MILGIKTYFAFIQRPEAKVVQEDSPAFGAKNVFKRDLSVEENFWLSPTNDTGKRYPWIVQQI